MKIVSYWAVVSGLLLVVLTLAFPNIAELSYSQALSRFDAQNLAHAEAQWLVSESWVGIFITFFLSVSCVVAGLLMLRRKMLGWRLWLVTCGLFIAYSIADVWLSDTVAAPLLRATWWTGVFWLSLRSFNQKGSLWFG